MKKIMRMHERDVDCLCHTLRMFVFYYENNLISKYILFVATYLRIMRLSFINNVT